jgi:hypothetical protein
MRSIHTNPGAAGILALSIACGALAAPALARRCPAPPPSLVQTPAAIAPATARSSVFPTAGARPKVCHGAPSITTCPSPNILRASDTAPRHAYGSDLEWAYLTIGGGSAALTLIGFGAMLGGDRLRKRHPRARMSPIRGVPSPIHDLELEQMRPKRKP